MTSPKEEWRYQISDYDISFIKGGWLVDKSNRPSPPPHDYEGQKHPMTNRVKRCINKKSSLKKSFSHIFPNLLKFTITASQSNRSNLK